MVATAPIAAVCAGASHAMLAAMPKVAILLAVLAAVSTLLCVDYWFGAPGLRAFADQTWHRRQDRRRREALAEMTRLDEEAGLL